MTWEEMQPNLPVWHRMDGAAERGLFAVMGIEPHELV